MNENRGGNPIVTILLVIIAVMAFDAFFNGGRIVNSLKPEPTYTTVTTPTPQPYYQPQQNLTVVTATPPPAVQNLVTPLPAPTVDFQATTDAFYTNDPLPTAPPSLSSLPLTSPYSLEEIAICRAIWDQGLQNPMIEPQYSNCEHWLTITGK